MGGALLLYGATGYTGRLLARAALAGGMSPVLCGRDEAKVRTLASELRLDCRVAGQTGVAPLDPLLEGIRVVLNAAGPFSTTAPPFIDACLRAGVHYLDVTGEVGVIDAASRRDGEARRRGIMVMPAVGFDVVASDCLAAHVVRRTRGAARIAIGVSGLELLTRGSARTIIEQLDQPVWVRRRGELGRIPAASLERSFDYGAGPRPSVVVSWGDVASAYFTTGVPDITAYFEATAAVRMHSLLLRLFGWAIPLTPWQDLLRTGVQWLPEGPSQQEREARQAVLVVEAEGADGEVVRSRLRTPEAFSFTASAATAIVARVLAGDLEPGFQTPARVYGADLVLSLPGASREDF